jgi:tetratricopeptide (TPR) repeat protein
MLRLRPVLTALLLSAALALAACDSAEERAEKHYQSALALLEKGDEDRALVELRNVFNLNGFHKEARRLYADTVLKQGKLPEAYGQYLRLVEQYPDTPEVRRDLAQLAFLRNDWDEVDRHGREALRLAPDDLTVKAVAIALDYRAAAIAGDDAAMATAATAAEAYLALPAVQAAPKPAALPGGAQIVRRILIADRTDGPDPQSAMPLLEAAIAAEPGVIDYHMMKLRLLAQAEDAAGTGAQLKDMIARFPENAEVKGAMIAWYLSQKDIDGAEAFLRQQAGADTAAPDGHVAVIQLLQAAKGPEAARTEVERLLAANQGTPNADLYGALLATLDFEAGQQAGAVAAMEAILEKAAPSDQTRRLKIMLARMLESTGNAVGARARIEEVLAEDATMVEALKMRAAARIQADDPGGAIVDLRAALDQAPRDSQVLTLMAEAHARDGARDLAGERLALAVEVSGKGAAESLRYAEFLLRDRRVQPALAVLTDARRANPANADVLSALARLHLSQSAWAEAEEAATALAALPLPAAQTTAQEIRAAILLGQERVDEGLSFLSAMVDDKTAAGGGNDSRAVAMILETQVRAGRVAEARAYLDGVLAQRPDDTDLRMMSAGLHALAGETDKAEAIYRAMIAADPAAEAPVRFLYAILSAANRHDEAAALLDQALAAQPASGTLRWMKAGLKEKAGDIDGAIAIYEAMYAEDSANVIVANNLASLITTHKTDAASLDRAFAVARRLRGLEVPAFQDTYGWIAFRRGETAEALAHLEPAAAGLPDDALVQYHFGMALAATGRADDARRQFARAIEIAGADSPLPQIAEARAKLAELGGPLPAEAAPAPAPAPAPAQP